MFSGDLERPNLKIFLARIEPNHGRPSYVTIFLAPFNLTNHYIFKIVDHPTVAKLIFFRLKNWEQY